MTIHILRDKATPEQVSDMLQILESYIKLAVDIERHVIAGGGRMHAEAEEKLLKNGSRQEDIWGADWDPKTQTVSFEALTTYDLAKIIDKCSFKTQKFALVLKLLPTGYLSA